MESQSIHKVESRTAILILGVMFFSFGFLSWINAILIPYFKIACELTHFESYFVAFAFYISYLVFSMPSSFLIRATGYKKAIFIGFAAASVGALIFVPAAMVRSFPVFLVGLFTIGCGLAILQPIANLYITTIGDTESAARRISMVGICNKFAGIVAPFIFSLFLLVKGDDQIVRTLQNLPNAQKEAFLDHYILRVIPPYAFMGVFLLLIGFLIYKSSLPELPLPDKVEKSQKNSLLELINYPNLILGAVAIFLHVGTQVIAVDTIINYGVANGMTLWQAKVLPSYTLSFTILGYFFGILLIPKVVSQTTALKICTILGLIIAISVCCLSNKMVWFENQIPLTVLLLACLGLPNALIWAGIWPLALKNLGQLSSQGASLLIMGLCGNAILPLVYGALSDTIGLQQAYIVLPICFVYLIFYALVGQKMVSWNGHS